MQNNLPKQNLVFLLWQISLLPDGGKKCCCYGWIPKRVGSISPSDFDGELSEILVKSCLSSTLPVNELVLFLFSALCEVLALLLQLDYQAWREHLFTYLIGNC